MSGASGIKAILFDKDGTLFDFGATWNVWTQDLLADLSGGDANRAAALAQAIGFDVDRVRFLPHSPAIAGTNAQVAEALARVMPGVDPIVLERDLSNSAAEAPLQPAVPLAPFLDALVARGLSVGVMTNDSEVSARAHLTAAGVFDTFDFVAGADSGYGAKPDPDPLLAFCQAVGVAPGQAVMVGDSTHDLIAGRAAGMKTVGVLTGMAGTEELTELAEIVLPDIGHLLDWLDR